MRIALAADERTPLVDHLGARLVELGHEVVPVAEGEAWPEVGRRAGQAVASGQAERAVVCCWTGTGVAMAAGKVPGVRAALCGDAETARGARRWNDANVLALSLRLTTEALADELLDAFLATFPDPDELAAVARVEPPESG
jgi:ribose 5-phosphate isomerase B